MYETCGLYARIVNLKSPLALAYALRVIVRTLDEGLAAGSIANARASVAQGQHKRQLRALLDNTEATSCGLGASVENLDDFASMFDGVQMGVTLPG